MPASEADKDLVRRIRAGEEAAWQECIALYEGRLQAFVYSRLRSRETAEDVVQETFLGFLTALPNFDDETPIESFLFAIAAHKLTDQLRRQGRRPTLPLQAEASSGPSPEPTGTVRVASSIARSREQHQAEEFVVSGCLRELVQQWLRAGEFERLKCSELLFVSGFPNKRVAQLLGISEQAVANHKYFVVSKLKEAAQRAGSHSVDLSRFGIADP